MPEVSGKLDFGLAPGKSNMGRWEMRVDFALSQYHEFTKAGKEGRATVWRLATVHVPAEPASKVAKRGKEGFMGKGKSMGQGGH